MLLLLSDLESLPRLVDVRDETSLRGNVGRPVAQAKLCLKGVEVGLQAALLLGLRGLGDSGILTELFETALSILEGVLRHAVFEPWHRLSNPLKQLKRRKEREREREREMSLWAPDENDYISTGSLITIMHTNYYYMTLCAY